MEQLLSTPYIKEVFGKKFPSSTLYQRYFASPKNVDDFEKLMDGVERIIEDEGAILSYPLAVLLNNTFSLSQPSTRRAWTTAFGYENDKYFAKTHLSIIPAHEALTIAFGNQETDVRVTRNYNIKGIFDSCRLFFCDDERMKQYLNNHFEYYGQSNGTKFVKPLFSLDGF